MIFYLPIYKQSKEEFNDFVASKAQKEIDNISLPENGGSVPDRLQIQIRSRLQTEYGCSWEQNRAVGWVKVARGKGGFSFFIAKSDKLKSKSPKKVFSLIEPNVIPGSWHVIDFSKCKNGEEVLGKFKEVLAGFVEEGDFKGCFVDLSQIQEIHKFVDWPGLIASEL
ncbi:hypothetical protein ACONUD_07540 [Microbulbifer harenosus]|uniref:Uncharacterized protein n=1 Tax=Microbulbifer harenosus TaxID=2576840 RepID=A0ABY2UEF3_9GAMM|nr:MULTISPECIES: hypothetical protein [Microbulbifer]QIL89604.1 hypothetical protein GNX18_07445 [Microbulbifer sp. SH-1]TLM73677.1 hypothetical protein FDY93_18860 [Microbulbifer harenosus]